MKESIIRLRALEKQRFAYRYALNVVDFDAETVAPEGSARWPRRSLRGAEPRRLRPAGQRQHRRICWRQAAQDAETEQERAEVPGIAACLRPDLQDPG